MRRGDLAEYPLAGVMAEAGRDRVSGAIELHTSRPAVLFIHDGRIYMAVRAGEMAPEVDQGLDDRHYQAALVAEEIRQRSRVVDILREQVENSGEGYYFHQPLIDHPFAGAWGWAPSSLYDEAAAQLEAGTVADSLDAGAADPGSDGGPSGSPSSDGATGPDETGTADAGRPEGSGEPVRLDEAVVLAPWPPEGPIDQSTWDILRDLVGVTALDRLADERGTEEAVASVMHLRDLGIVVTGPASVEPPPSEEPGPEPAAEDADIGADRDTAPDAETEPRGRPPRRRRRGR